MPRARSSLSWRPQLPDAVLRTVLLLLFCFSGLGADRTIAQFVHKSWDTKNGAPPNITAITQTNDGYLWLASTKGLYRFDGVEFERFEPPGQTPTSGPVYSLLSCANGDLWVGSARSGIGLVRDRKSRNYTAADGMPEGAVLSIAQGQDGKVWAATQGGLARFDGSVWKKIGADSGLSGAPPVSVFADRHGSLWAASPDSIFELPRLATKFHRTDVKAHWVMEMVESPTGVIWMAETVGAIRPMPPVIGPHIDYGSQKIMFDRDGSLWITTLGEGLRRASQPNQLPSIKITKSSALVESFTAKDGLSSDYALSIFQDREGNVWVGTAGGLDRFSKGAVVPVPVPGKLNRTTIVSGDGGDVWVGCLSKNLGRVHGNEWYPASKQFVAFSSIADPRGGTWWSTYSAILRETNGRFTVIDFPPAYRQNGEPTRMALDSSGAVWVAGVFGVLRHDTEWKSVEVPRDFPGKTPTTAYADATGRIWIGYRQNSILVFDQSSRQIFSANQGLRAGSVEAILVSGAFAWIAGSNGLQLFDGKRFRDITLVGGETLGGVSGIVESNGAIWLNSPEGIVRIAPTDVSKLKAGDSKAECTRFDTYDGLPGAAQQSQPYPTLIQAKDGKLWFGTSGGPAWIDPNNLPRNTVIPAVVIKSLTSNRKQYTSFAGLRLPALTRDLEIEYTALTFTVPERVQFRYKLEGSDKDWQDAGTRRTAFYTNLGPGQYRFLLMACNNDGVWNESGETVSFRIDPAFHQTVWFQLVCYAAVLAVLSLFYRLRLKQATAQINSRLEGQVVERERIARELHDTLLQSFQGLMLRLHVVYELLPAGRAKEQLEQSLERADQAIAEGRRAVYDLRSSLTENNDVAQAMQLFADDLAGDGCPKFNMVIEGSVRPLHPIPRDEIYRIACECLRNAFKHARAARVEAEIIYGEREFRLRVRDDGQGIPRDILESGRAGHYGLRGMRERAKESGARLEIWSGAGSGTEIELNVPGSVAYRQFSGRSGTRLFRKSRR